MLGPIQVKRQKSRGGLHKRVGGKCDAAITSMGLEHFQDWIERTNLYYMTPSSSVRNAWAAEFDEASPEQQASMLQSPDGFNYACWNRAVGTCADIRKRAFARLKDAATESD